MRSLASAFGLGAILIGTLTAGCTDGSSARTPGASELPTAVSSTGEGNLVPVVSVGEFEIRYVLEASTVLSDGVPVEVPLGTSWGERVPDGREVRAGDYVGTTTLRPDVQTELEGSSHSSDRVRLSSLEMGVGDVSAPIDGVVSSDGTSLRIDSGGIEAVAMLTGMQSLRLASLPISGSVTVETTLGQRLIACDALWVTQPDAGLGLVDYGLHCRIPSYIETSANLRATIEVVSDKIVSATLVPNVAVGASRNGSFVCLEREAGGSVQREVDLGPSDGVMRVITSDLDSGLRLHIPDGTTCG